MAKLLGGAIGFHNSHADFIPQPSLGRTDLELDELVGYALALHNSHNEAPGRSPSMWLGGTIGHDDPELDELVNGCALALHMHIEALQLAPVLPENPLPAFDEWRGFNFELAPSADSLQLIHHMLSVSAHTLGVSSEVLVMSVVLIERLMRAVGTERGPLRPRNLRRLLATGLSLAAKTYYDEPLGLADIQGFLLQNSASTASLAECELQFLTLIRFKTFVPAGVFQQYRSAALELLEAKYLFALADYTRDVEAHQNQNLLSTTTAAASTLIFWQCLAVG
ncbi:hypothetical protein T492DRAFT_864736 [Pavlovales sp. CCMP2436]|nr:hypothetical protein T492DRAFT_864736 [Pavlovales sp. CCMP2436]|eukprot:CAMPEP_0180001848 /NCGR_PEP_ID=MMETSP0984-20121128/10625_1 /TAXON_ID=483367 /ORGANISM="non described non described, Strain CCMP 2436" /LENGTH=279 /DNA_ID=CAMNT_0021922009 /DNA_START=15 /DNA_END=854 /DNA_ORIENTATION=-